MKRDKKKKSILKIKKNSSKELTSSSKKKRTSKKKQDVTKKKKSEGENSFVEKSVSKKNYGLKMKKDYGVEDVQEEVNKNQKEMLACMNKKSKQNMRGEKFPDNVSTIPLDSVSFHLEESVLK